jgi:hypothetical protein
MRGCYEGRHVYMLPCYSDRSMRPWVFRTNSEWQRKGINNRCQSSTLKDTNYCRSGRWGANPNVVGLFKAKACYRKQSESPYESAVC